MGRAGRRPPRCILGSPWYLWGGGGVRVGGLGNEDGVGWGRMVLFCVFGLVKVMSVKRR